MALTKITYTDDVTVIEAENLNDIQDEIITNASLFSPLTKYKGTMGEDPNTSLDFNDYKTSGIYYNGGTNATPPSVNPPHSADNGWLVVAGWQGTRATQIWCSAYQGTLKTRKFNGTTWSQWEDCITALNGTFFDNVTVNRRSGSTALADSYLVAGNNIPNGTVGNSRGIIELFSEQSYYANIYPRTLTANRSLYVPDATGTIAIQDRILKQEASVEVVGNPTGWVYKNITFPTPFIKQPLVSVSLYGTSYATDWTMPMLANVTQTGFQMGWWHASGTRNVYWQAFGII